MKRVTAAPSNAAGVIVRSNIAGELSAADITMVGPRPMARGSRFESAAPTRKPTLANPITVPKNAGGSRSSCQMRTGKTPNMAAANRFDVAVQMAIGRR